MVDLGRIGIPIDMIAESTNALSAAFTRAGSHTTTAAPRRGGPPNVSFVVCFTMRSGSTLLCDLLGSTNRLGMPAEYLNIGPGNSVEALGARYGTYSLPEYLDAVVGDRQTANGVFGLKAGFRQFIPVVAADLTGRLGSELHYVYLTRRDLLAQSISLVRANQTWQWNSKMESRADPHYDPDAIVERMIETTQMMGFWERWFATEGIDPLRLHYEDLVADPIGVAGSVARMLGETPPDDSEMSASVTAQRDALTDAWIARFRETWR